MCINISKLLSSSLRYLYATELWLSVIHIGFIKLELCRGWKWYVGSLGREMLACMIRRYYTHLLVLVWREARSNPRSPD